MGIKISKNTTRLLLKQIAVKMVEICPEFSSQWSSQKQVAIL